MHPMYYYYLYIIFVAAIIYITHIFIKNLRHHDRRENSRRLFQAKRLFATETSSRLSSVNAGAETLRGLHYRVYRNPVNRVVGVMGRVRNALYIKHRASRARNAYACASSDAPVTFVRAMYHLA